MNEQDIFNTPNQEAARLATALGEVKEVLRDVQRQIAAIEARAKRAFPSAFPKPPPRTERSTDKSSTPPTMSAEQVMRLYDQVVELAGAHGPDTASARLDEIGLGDLNFLRKELGVSLSNRKPSKNTIVKSILRRVNESLLLTKHTNRQELLSRAQSEE